jgi:hypothetical protein
MTVEQTNATRTAAQTYFESWRARDFGTLRTVLAPEVEFAGVFGTANGIDECVAGLKGMADSIMVDLVLHARVADGNDVITWFDLIAPNIEPIPTANWSHRGGRTHYPHSRHLRPTTTRALAEMRRQQRAVRVIRLLGLLDGRSTREPGKGRSLRRVLIRRAC